MTDSFLLARLEDQAVQIEKLQMQLRLAQERLRELPQEIRLQVWREMSHSAINCDTNYGCRLAKQIYQGYKSLGTEEQRGGGTET